MAEFLFSLHSGVRYLVLATGLVTVLLGLQSAGRPAPRGTTAAWRAFLGLLDLQVVAGVLVLATRPFQGQYIGHFTMMIVAAVVAHGIGATFRRRPAERRSGGLLAVGALVALALIVAGILAIGRAIV